jgi:hypothetical protein
MVTIFVTRDEILTTYFFGGKAWSRGPSGESESSKPVRRGSSFPHRGNELPRRKPAQESLHRSGPDSFVSYEVSDGSVSALSKNKKVGPGSTVVRKVSETGQWRCEDSAPYSTLPLAVLPLPGTIMRRLATALWL